MICITMYSSYFLFPVERGWSGVAMDLDKLPVPRRLTIWMMVEQGPSEGLVGWLFWA